MKRTSALAIASLLALPVLADSSHFVPGEWIVTFSPKSRMRAELEQAPPEKYEGARDAVSAELSERIGLPLRLGAASGGGIWVVHVDAGRALRAFERELETLEGVRQVRRLSDAAELRQGLARDRGFELLCDAETSRAKLTRALERVLLPVVFEGGESEFATVHHVRVDWRALTQRLLGEFDGLDDVEHAELNALQGPAPARTGSHGPVDGFSCNAS